MKDFLMHAFIQVVSQIADSVQKSRDLSFSQGFGSTDSMKYLKTNLLLFCIGHFNQKYLPVQSLLTPLTWKAEQIPFCKSVLVIFRRDFVLILRFNSSAIWLKDI